MAQATLSVRLDRMDKEHFEAFCQDAGLNVSVAINMFVKSVIKNQKIPFEITGDPGSFEAISEALAAKGIETAQAEVTMLPDTTIQLAGSDAETMMNLVDALEEQDDVQNVYGNFDVPDEDEDE